MYGVAGVVFFSKSFILLYTRNIHTFTIPYVLSFFYNWELVRDQEKSLRVIFKMMDQGAQDSVSATSSIKYEDMAVEGRAEKA